MGEPDDRAGGFPLSPATPSRLRGTTCVVTGASRGIGHGLAELFASQGANLVLCARSGADLAEVAEGLRADFGAEVVASPIDVTDAAGTAKLAQTTLERFGPAGVLVNNAATLGPVGRIDRVDLEEWRRTLDVNVAGVANVSAAFAPQMLDAGRGAIINLSGGGTGGPNLPERVSAYSASKGAVVALTEVLAKELAPVRVNAIAPGAMPTTFMREVLDRGPDMAGTALYDTTVRQQASPDSTDDLHALVLFLASDESAWLTGKLLSARWDRVDALIARRARLESSSLCNLRRIDDALYTEVDS